jgi:hypothetical protein
MARPVREGAVLPDGKRSSYKLNRLGLFCLLVSLVAVAGWLKLGSLAILVTYFWPLFFTENR